MKWERRWDGNRVAGYIAHQGRVRFCIVKGFALGDELSCDLNDQGQEKSSSWELYRGRKYIETYPTLREAQQAAEKL
jgi:hypothetical protein